MSETTIVVKVSGDPNITRRIVQGADDILFLTDCPCHSCPGALNLHKTNIGSSGTFADWRRGRWGASRFAVHNPREGWHDLCGEMLAQ
jgi:hypothetical protein